MVRELLKKHYLIWLLLAVEVFITLYGLTTMPSWGDESNYHYPLVQTISWQSIINEHSSYSSAYTPLPYIIGNVFYNIFPSLYTLRFINWLVVFISVFLFYNISVKVASKNRWELTLLYTANPYLLRASFMYLMFGYGILLALAGIYIYFYSSIKNAYLWTNICFLLAVLSMQWMLVLYAALVLNELDIAIRNEWKIKETLKRLFLPLITMIPAFLLFWQWHGLTHPNFHSHTLVASLAHVNSVLSVVGFTFLFYGIYKLHKLNYNQLRPIIVLLFLLPVLYFGHPQHASGHGLQNFTGVVSAFLKKIEILTGFPYAIGLTFFSTLGMIVLYLMLLGDKNRKGIFLLLVITGLLTAFTVNTLLGASHVFVAVPFLLLYSLRYISNHRIVLRLMEIQFYGMTIVYIIYIITFRAYGNYFVS